MKIRYQNLLSILFLWPGISQAKELSSKPQEPPRQERIEIKDTGEKFKNSLVLTFPTFHAVILDEKGPIALLGVEASLAAQTIEKTAIIHDKWVKLQSAIIEDLHSIAPFLWEKGYKPTIHSLEKRIFRLCKEILGPDVLESVKIQKAYMRKLTFSQPKGHLSYAPQERTPKEKSPEISPEVSPDEGKTSRKIQS